MSRARTLTRARGGWTEEMRARAKPDVRPGFLETGARGPSTPRATRMEVEPAPASLTWDMPNENERRFRTLIENARDIIYRYEFLPEPRLRYVSPAVTEVLGYTEEEHYADPNLAFKVIHPGDRLFFLRIWRGRVEVPDLFGLRLVRKDGRVVWTEHHVRFLYDGKRSLTAIEGVGRDISDRRRLEDGLRVREETERQFRKQLTVLVDVTNRLSRVGSTDDLARLAVELGQRELGFSRLSIWCVDNNGESLKGMYGVDEDGQVRDERAIRSPIHPGSTHEQTFKRKRGFVYERRSDLRDCTGKIVGKGDHVAAAIWDGENVIGVLHADNLLSGKPITPPMRRILKLYASVLGHLCARLHSEEKFHKLSMHLRTLREQEKTRIAREIHDELGQSLTGIKLQLSWLRENLDSDKEALARKVQSVIGIVDSSILSLQRICVELRPAILDDLGLLDAIEWMAQEFVARTGIECRVSARPRRIPLKGYPATALFRICQEALTNVARHANATRVRISLRWDNGNLMMRVADNGRGITEREVTAPDSFGITCMRERAVELGGSVMINGKMGTTLTVRLPVRMP
ncbi:MAG: PAS domain-containing sensor histidine kinase [Candidatus Omnitrophica bacterium]|nr:PAS domain-containing sensor histidine kinase [Candidatus Omnitrophota bacterium]